MKNVQESGEARPCSGCAAFKDMEKCMETCTNCRREVEASMSRIGGRKLRKLRSLPECSIASCVQYLLTIQNMRMRLHFASMAWWRFSSDEDDGKANPLLRVMRSCGGVEIPDIGTEYLHDAIRALSPLSKEQMVTWFGFDNLYHMATLFGGDTEDEVPEQCSGCRLFKQGCTAYNTNKAKTCPFLKDRFLQDIAREVARSDGWRDPYGSMLASSKGKSK